MPKRRKMPGLFKRGEVWHIDKQVKGYGRIRESCRTSDEQEAERYLAHRLLEAREESVYGIRPTRTFEQAAVKYLEENQHKRSLDRDVIALKHVMPYIGQLPIDRVHNDALLPFRKYRLALGRSAGTINKELATVRRILQLAARVWRHPNGKSWLPEAPLLTMEKGPARKPYPISWEEQARLFQQLPPHLERVALFAVNTGCRAGEIRQLKWDWEVRVPEIGCSVFIIPDEVAKNGCERVVIVNRAASAVVNGERGEHSTYVFSYRGRPISRVRTHAWKRARDRACLPQVRVHDLRHTFGHRLRAAGVGLEDREDLLGHKSDRMTTYYSAPDLQRLLDAANSLCEKRPATLLRIASNEGRVLHKIPTA